MFVIFLFGSNCDGGECREVFLTTLQRSFPEGTLIGDITLEEWLLLFLGEVQSPPTLLWRCCRGPARNVSVKESAGCRHAQIITVWRTTSYSSFQSFSCEYDSRRKSYSAPDCILKVTAQIRSFLIREELY